MANEFTAAFNAADVIAETAGGPTGGMNQLNNPTPVGLGMGAGFGPKQTSTCLGLFRVQNAALLATGLTVELVLADDVNNPGAGKNAVFGVTIGPITSGTSTFDESVLTSATEVTATVTMPATPGVMVIQAIALPVADLHGLAAGNTALVRIRRLGSNSSDTHPGRVVMLNADVRNT